MDKSLLIHVAVLLGLTAVAVSTAQAAEPAPARQQELVHLVRQDCGSCHGMRLAGGLGPALLPARLADWPDESLVATILLAAKMSPLWQVVAGTTVGMLLANVPVVLLGSRFASKLPLKAARITAACVFLVLGLWAAIAGIGG